MSNFENSSKSSGNSAFWQRYTQLPRNVLALSFVSLFNDVSSETIYPLLPFFLTLTLGASPFAIGLIEGAAESVSSLLKLAAGYFSDRFSQRKIPVLAGYALSGAVRPLLGLATGWIQVLLLRLVDRTGKGIRSAPRDALVADSITPEKRGLAFGFHRAMDNLGAVIGPLVAYFLLRFLAVDQFNPTAAEYSQVFWLASIPAFLAIIVIAFFVQENTKLQDSNPTARLELKTTILRGKTKLSNNFKRYLFILALFTLANSSDAFLLLRAQEAGISPVNIPLLWTFLSLVKVISSLLFGDLSDKIGRRALIFTGWILYAAVYTGFAFVTTAGGAWTLFLIYGVYFGLTEGAEKALVSDLVPPERRGVGFGWYHLAFGIAIFPASLMTGAIWTFYGPSASFLTCACISLIAAFLFLTVKTRQTSDEI